MKTIKQIEKICQTIYDDLGGGMCELNYQKALEIELREHNIKYMSKLIIPYKYKDWTLSFGEADIYLPEDNIVIELKVLSWGITQKEISQTMGYMKHIGIDNCKGLILNFVPPASKKRPSKLESYFIDTVI